VKNEDDWKCLLQIKNAGNIYLPWFYSDQIVAMDDDERLIIKNNIRRLVYKHRYFASAEWAMGEDLIGEIGDGLTLMNIVTKNVSGKIKAVHTYIGYEGNGFACVSHAEGLDQPGVIYRYSNHVKMLKANLPILLECFWYNIK
jgi:hypothetical protein